MRSEIAKAWGAFFLWFHDTAWHGCTDVRGQAFGDSLRCDSRFKSEVPTDFFCFLARTQVHNLLCSFTCQCTPIWRAFKNLIAFESILVLKKKWVKVISLGGYFSLNLASYLDPFFRRRCISEILRSYKPDLVFCSISNVTIHLNFRFINKHLK